MIVLLKAMSMFLRGIFNTTFCSKWHSKFPLIETILPRSSHPTSNSDFYIVQPTNLPTKLTYKTYLRTENNSIFNIFADVTKCL